MATRWSGREMLRFLNPAPIRSIRDQRLSKFIEHRGSALTDLNAALEEAL